jgi:hypothetical protein
MDAGDAARAAMAQRKDVQPEWVITIFGTLVDGLKAATTSPAGPQVNIGILQRLGFVQTGKMLGLNIAALKGDIGWEPLLVTPPHPEYPSAHAMFSGAAEAVLRGFFGDDQVDVSVTAPGPFGVTRTYHKFSELTEEVDNARVWGGIHFRSADVDGSEIGRKIGEIILREFANSPRKTTQLGERP